MSTHDVHLNHALCVYNASVRTYTYISRQFEECKELQLQFADVDTPIIGVLCPEYQYRWTAHISKAWRLAEHTVSVHIQSADKQKYVYEEIRRVLPSDASFVIERIINLHPYEETENTENHDVTSEDVLTTFIDFAPIVKSLLLREEHGLIVTDATGIIRVANEAVFSLFGVAREYSVIGKNIREAFPFFQKFTSWFGERDHATLNHMTDTTTQKRRVEFYEPTTRWLQVEVFPTQFGLTFNLVDVSKEFQQSEKIGILSSVATNSLSSVVITDKQGYIEWVNKAFEIITGYSMAEAIGKKPGLLLQGKDTDPAAIAAIRQALSDCSPFSGEILNYHKEGHAYWVRLEITPVFDAHGELLRFISVQVDTTEHHRNVELLGLYNERLEEKIADRTIEILKKNHELEAALERMGELSQEQDDILALVAHDLKNPLTSIMLNCSLLQRNTLLTSDHKVMKYLDSIERTSERIDHIIKYILSSYQRSNGESMKVQSSICNLADTLVSVVKEFELLALAKDIACTIDIQNMATKTITDENAILHILENLLSNAIKYSPHHSTVTVGIYPEDMYDGFIAIYVRDQGPGFTSDDKTKLFKKFQRLSATPTGGEHSTGLGLSLVKKLVRAIHAEIFLNHEYSSGAEFVLCVRCNVYHNEVSEYPHRQLSAIKH